MFIGEHKQYKSLQKNEVKKLQKNIYTPKVSKTEKLEQPSIMQESKINPNSLRYEDVMQLQRTIGNQGVIQLFKNSKIIKDKSQVVQKKHLSHETWHAVQQGKGKVKSTRQFKGMPINYDKELEQEGFPNASHESIKDNDSRPYLLTNLSKSRLRGEIIQAKVAIRDGNGNEEVEENIIKKHSDKGEKYTENVLLLLKKLATPYQDKVKKGKTKLMGDWKKTYVEIDNIEKSKKGGTREIST